MFFENNNISNTAKFLPSAVFFPKEYLNEVEEVLTVEQINKVLALTEGKPVLANTLKYFAEQQAVIMEWGISTEKSFYLSRLLGLSLLLSFPDLNVREIVEYGRNIFLTPSDWLSLAAKLKRVTLCDELYFSHTREIQGSLTLQAIKITAEETNCEEILDWVQDKLSLSTGFVY